MIGTLERSRNRRVRRDHPLREASNRDHESGIYLKMVIACFPFDAICVGSSRLRYGLTTSAMQAHLQRPGLFCIHLCSNDIDSFSRLTESYTIGFQVSTTEIPKPYFEAFCAENLPMCCFRPQSRAPEGCSATCLIWQPSTGGARKTLDSAML
jgi:hypothetical protein